jgi:hypothetical protein
MLWFNPGSHRPGRLSKDRVFEDLPQSTLTAAPEQEIEILSSSGVTSRQHVKLARMIATIAHCYVSAQYVPNPYGSERHLANRLPL